MTKIATIHDSESGEILMKVQARSMNALFRELNWEKKVLDVTPAKFAEYNTSEAECECRAFIFGKGKSARYCKHVEAYRRRTASLDAE